MLYLIYSMIFLSIMLLALSFLSPRQEDEMPKLPVIEQRDDIDIYREKFHTPSWLKFFDIINKPLLPRPYRESMLRRLFMAKVNFSPEVFLGIKEFGLVAFSLLGYTLIKSIQPIWVFMLAGLGFALPDLWLRAKIGNYKQEILKALPDTVDLLSLCVGAGLDFVLSVKAVIEKSSPNPLIEELHMVSQEIKMGKPRQEALRDMSKRLDINEVSSFVRTLNQADKMGTSVTDALGMLSEEARLQRFRRAERMALKAPIKLLFPLIFFILPVVAIIVGGPVLLQFMQGGIKF